MKQFSRDIFVNVLANLVAAALVYIAGAYLGLFPRNALLASSFGIVGILAALGVAVSTTYILERRRGNANGRFALWRGSVLVLAGTSVGALALASPSTAVLPLTLGFGFVATALGLQTAVPPLNSRFYAARRRRKRSMAGTESSDLNELTLLQRSRPLTSPYHLRRFVHGRGRTLNERIFWGG